MRMIPLSVFAQRMHVAYMTAWKWYTRGWLTGSVHGENGITVPENLHPGGFLKVLIFEKEEVVE